MTFYFGACAGGVWKTTDGGWTWLCMTDGQFTTAAVGALAVAPSDPNVIYAGTGEACIRNDVSHGDGVYRSSDGGKTWTNMGLGDSRHIGRIVVHPRDAEPRLRRSARPRLGHEPSSAASSARRTAAATGSTSCSRANARARTTSRSIR